MRPSREGGNFAVSIEGDDKQDWRVEVSTNLVAWTNVAGFGTLASSETNAVARSTGSMNEGHRFYRAARTEGIFDPSLLRAIRLTFTNANWQTTLASGRTTGSNTPCVLVLDNGIRLNGVGARYKGNSSYTMGGTKKSVNLEMDFLTPEQKLMGFKTINLNNAAGDETIMREPVYFNVMRQYVPCPKGAMARLYINNAYWGVYSLIEQENTDLVDRWFPSNDGDRWRAPNISGGGGGFTGSGSAFAYLGTNVSAYSRNYELKTDNSTNAWQRLVRAIDILNNTPAAQLRERVEEAFAVDRWLWFLALENVLADDDSYWNKGADYGFYYELESGRIHPIEHDGNESFTVGDVSLSPVQGVTGTNRPLLNKLLSIPELRQRYLAHMRTVLEESFNPAVVTPMINAFHALSVADIIADTRKNFAMSAYTNDLVALRSWVTNRHRFLTNHTELRSLAPRILAVRDPNPKPGPADIPTITARVEANGGNGIDSVWLYWRDKTYGRFASRRMFDDGAHGDDGAGDGLYGAVTTNFPAGHKIHYYVEARSANTARTAAFSPPRAEEETFSYRVGLTTNSSTAVIINELMASNSQTLADPQGEFDDWIELRNLAEQEMDLSGHYLSDEPNNPRKWAFPAGTKITAHGFLLVWLDEDGSDTPGLHASFKLSSSGEEVFLTDTDANLNAVLDSIQFGIQETDVSHGRLGINPAVFGPMTPSPGQANP